MAKKRTPPVDGGMSGNRSRTDFAGSSTRRAVRLDHEAGIDGARVRRSTEMQAHWSQRGRVSGERGSMPRNGVAPQRPPMLVFYDDLADGDPEYMARSRELPEPVYGQYPEWLIPKLLPWLRCERHQILHVCSGALPPGEGIRVDVRREARPDVVADGRALPRDLFPDGSVAAVLIDPPYSEHYARELYGVEYPRPSDLLAEAARVVRPGGRIGFIHYITPKPVAGTSFVKAKAFSTGFNMPVRAASIYERDHGLELALAGDR